VSDQLQSSVSELLDADQIQFHQARTYQRCLNLDTHSYMRFHYHRESHGKSVSSRILLHIGNVMNSVGFNFNMVVKIKLSLLDENYDPANPKALLQVALLDGKTYRNHQEKQEALLADGSLEATALSAEPEYADDVIPAEFKFEKEIEMKAMAKECVLSQPAMNLCFIMRPTSTAAVAPAETDVATDATASSERLLFQHDFEGRRLQETVADEEDGGAGGENYELFVEMDVPQLQSEKVVVPIAEASPDGTLGVSTPPQGVSLLETSAFSWNEYSPLLVAIYVMVTAVVVMSLLAACLFAPLLKWRQNRRERAEEQPSGRSGTPRPGKDR
jgi:hypothetical protein